MKICIFTETYHPVIGGGETQARLLADGLHAHGHEVCVLTRRSDASLATTERVGDVMIHRIAPAGSGQVRKWGLVLTAIPALLRLRRAYDLVFVSGFRIIGLAAVAAGKLLGARVVLKADSQGEMSGAFFRAGLARFGASESTLAFRFVLRLRNAVLRRAHAFVAITNDVAAELIAARVAPAAIHRIPNAVDTTRFAPMDGAHQREIRRRLGLPVDAAIVAYTGRLVSYKGLPLLLRVWSTLHGSHPHAVLLLIGTGGLDIHACERELRETVRQERMEHTVVFTGGVQNVHEYLQASEVFVFPSENDAFPSSLIEAMATGLPVVATRVGAIPEIVQDGENGLLIAPGDYGALRGALDRLLADNALGARLGTAARRTVHARYSGTAVTQRYVELFIRVMNGVRGPAVPSR